MLLCISNESIISVTSFVIFLKCLICGDNTKCFICSSFAAYIYFKNVLEFNNDNKNNRMFKVLLMPRDLSEVLFKIVSHECSSYI